MQGRSERGGVGGCDTPPIICSRRQIFGLSAKRRKGKEKKREGKRKGKKREGGRRKEGKKKGEKEGGGRGKEEEERQGRSEWGDPIIWSPSANFWSVGKKEKGEGK